MRLLVLAVSVSAPCVCDLRGQLCMCAVCGCLPGVRLQPCYWLDLGSGAAAALLLSACLINMIYFPRSKQNLGNTGKVALAQRELF